MVAYMQHFSSGNTQVAAVPLFHQTSYSSSGTHCTRKQWYSDDKHMGAFPLVQESVGADQPHVINVDQHFLQSFCEWS